MLLGEINFHSRLRRNICTGYTVLGLTSLAGISLLAGAYIQAAF